MSAVDKKSELLVSLRTLSVDELKSKVVETKEDLFWLRFKNRSGQTISASEIQKKKVALARINTIIGEKERANDNVSGGQ